MRPVVGRDDRRDLVGGPLGPVRAHQPATRGDDRRAGRARPAPRAGAASPPRRRPGARPRRPGPARRTTPASSFARRAPAPRRRNAGGSGSSTRTPHTSRLPGSRSSARSPTRSGSGVLQHQPDGVATQGTDVHRAWPSPRRGAADPRAGGRRPPVTRTSTTPPARYASGVTSTDAAVQVAEVVTGHVEGHPRDPRRAVDRGAERLHAPHPHAGPPAPMLSVSPRATVPAGSVPVTTVPAPFTVNRRSTHSRTSAAGSGAGRRPTSVDQVVAQRVEPCAGPAAHRHDRRSAQRRAAHLVRRPRRRRRRVGEVRAGHGDDAVPHAEGVQRGEVLRGLRHPRVVGGDHEQHGGHGTDPGEHRRHEPLVPGHVDERHLARRRAATSSSSRAGSTARAGAPPPAGRGRCR